MRLTPKILCLVAACCLSVAGCKKSATAQTTLDDYNAAVYKGIRKHIKDKDRRNKLKALHAKAFMQQVDTALIFAAAGIKMRANPNLTREEAQAIIEESKQQRLLALKELSATKREMRSLVSAEEWNEIFVAPTLKGKE
jgi:gamma-glutamylcysteine synthetase